MSSNGTTESNFGSHSHDKAVVSITRGSAGIKEHEGTHEQTHNTHIHSHGGFALLNTHTHIFKGDRTVEHSWSQDGQGESL